MPKVHVTQEVVRRAARLNGCPDQSFTLHPDELTGAFKVVTKAVELGLSIMENEAGEDWQVQREPPTQFGKV